MAWTDIFESEQNFESKIKEAVNLEMQVASTIHRLEGHVTEREVKDKLKKFRDKANIQLQRLEELCDVYDIPLLGRSSIDVESMMNEMEAVESKSDGGSYSKKDILETAKEMETKEQNTLNNALSLARELGYEEAVDILRVAVSAPNFFNESTNK